MSLLVAPVLPRPAAARQATGGIKSSPCYTDWKTVANAGVIVVGTVEKGGEPAASLYRYITVKQRLKGKTESDRVPVVMTTAAVDPPDPRPAIPKYREGETVLVFLSGEKRLGLRYFLAGEIGSAVVPADAATLAAVRAEVENQKRINQKFSKLGLCKSPAASRKVEELVQSLAVRPDEKAEPWNLVGDVLALKDEACPCLAAYLDDHRPVIGGALSIPNRDPRIPEGVVHVKVSTVSEAADTLLWKITDEGFGYYVVEPASPQIRERIASAWRAYLYYRVTAPAGGKRGSGI